MSNTLKTRSAPPSTTPVLQPLLSRSLALSWTQLLSIVPFAVAYLYFSYLPLFHAELWNHVAFGRWILHFRTLPTQDPFAPLTAGMDVVNSEWLSQTIVAFSQQTLGIESLSYLFAWINLASLLILWRACYLMHRRPIVAGVSALAVTGLMWSRHAVFRPETFGFLCFALLLCLIAKPLAQNRSLGQRVARLAGGLLLFAAWVNLDASFLVGLGFLSCTLLGSAAAALARHRSPARMVADPLVRDRLFLLEAACLGALLNPAGLDGILAAIHLAASPALARAADWQPLLMTSVTGLTLGISWATALLCFRVSRQPLNAGLVTAWVALTVGVCLHERFITWYAPVLILMLQPQLADLLARWLPAAETRKDRPERPLTAADFRLTFAAIALVWITFSFSPSSRLLLGGTPRTPVQLHNAETPLGVGAFFQQHPPRGLVYNPQPWGDWLAFAAPAGTELFVTSGSLTRTPQTVWDDYLAISSARGGFSLLLDKYRINTIVADRNHQTRLTEELESLEGWSVVYEDEQAVVAKRAALAGTDSAADAQEPADTSAH